MRECTVPERLGRELAESWLELAVFCAKIPVKYEADIIKQQQKQEQAVTMKMEVM